MTQTTTMLMSELLSGFAESPLPAMLSSNVSGICCDSRDIQAGDMFLALPGENHHGLDFYAQVRAAGARAVLWQPPFSGELDEDPSCPLLMMPNLHQQIAAIADRFYADPSRQLKLIGITGTDGKTSCAHYIAQSLHTEATPCGLLGTVGNGLYGQLQNARLTTADIVSVRRSLAAMVAQGATYAVMEVSSHALAQQRVTGLEFAVAVLTNLGRDHLDYHGDSSAYAAAKRRLFVDHQTHCWVINGDDAFGRELLKDISSRIIVYSLGSGNKPQQGEIAELVRGDSLQLTSSGLHLRISSTSGEGELGAGLLGCFNASNLLATVATLLALEVPFAEALTRAAKVVNAPGRMECLGGHKGKPLAVIDYAHTPQALEQALRALREHCHGQLWCVFGCGGDRDPGKRPLMGEVAERWADRVIVTDDNPRDEPPEQIIAAALAGMTDPKRAQIVRGRDKAIAVALGEAAVDDVVLIAGKGHEDYQLIGGQRLPFSDHEQVRRCLAERAA